MRTPEGKVKDRIKAALIRAKAYYFMPVQNGMGSPSLDFIGCHQGRFFAVEAKAGRKQPTARQKLTAASMEAAGARTFVINEVEGLPELEDWLNGE